MKIKTMAAAAVCALAVAACSSAAASHASAPTHAAATYSTVEDVLNALSSGGLPCTGGDASLTPVVQEATSEIGCNFDPNSLVLVDVFPAGHSVSPAEVLTNSVSTGTEQIWTVYGANWWVQTDTTYDHRVQGILGGTILAGPWHPATTQATPSPVASVDYATAGVVCANMNALEFAGNDPADAEQTVEGSMNLSAGQVVGAISERCPQLG
jgi:hypothetical protein